MTKSTVTLDDINANIVSEHYFTAADALSFQLAASKSNFIPDGFQRLTFCILTLNNGFVVTGESACVHPANFDPEKGRVYARENAIAKVWPLMGYELRSKIFKDEMVEEGCCE